MAIRFINAEPKFTPNAAAITQFSVIVPHVHDLETGDVRIDRKAIAVKVAATQYAPDGQREDHNFTIPITEIPPAGRDMLKQMYAWLETQLEARGIAGDGVADPLDQP